jgi:hypothetical protein
MIAKDDVNVSTDIVLCRKCGKTFSFSQLLNGSSSGGADLTAPPRGAWFEQIPGGFRVGASTRSAMALFFIPFTCAWSGMSMSGIYGTQIKSGHFDPSSSLFGLPFLIGTVCLVSVCAMMIAGKVEVTRSGDMLSVFSGVGLLGWTRSFRWSDFDSVREEVRRNGWNGNFSRQGPVILLEGRRRVAFGSMWNDERRYFVLSALRSMFGSSNRAQSTTIMAPQFR